MTSRSTTGARICLLVAACVRSLSAALLLASCWSLTPECDDPTELPAGAPDVRVLSYNIGNGNKERPYALRIRDRAYENHVGERIRELAPDIVLLQEVLPPTACESFSEHDPARTCYPDPDAHPAAAKRILGPAYSVACDQREHVECIGVRSSFGTIRGVEPGGFALAGAETSPLPGRACDYLAGHCSGRSNTCDAESSISTVIVDTANGPLRIIHVHPTAIGEVCLARQVEQAFALVDDLPTLIGGDWNFDPTRASDLVPAAIWYSWVGEGRRFANHSERVGACRLDSTSAGRNMSLDRVISDFAVGRCKVWREPRLDDGFDFAALDGARIDHFAVECSLYVGEP